MTKRLPAPRSVALTFVALVENGLRKMVAVASSCARPPRFTLPAPRLSINVPPPAWRSQESEPVLTVTAPVDVPLNSIERRTNGPGKSSVATYVCVPVEGKTRSVLALETGRAVQFPGSLHTPLVGEVHVCAAAHGANDPATAHAEAHASAARRKPTVLRDRIELALSKVLRRTTDASAATSDRRG